MTTLIPGRAFADTNPATAPLVAACTATPGIDIGTVSGATGVAVGDAVQLASALSLSAGQVYQDILTRPDGTPYYASFVSLRYDATYLTPTGAPTLTVGGVSTPMVNGVAPQASAWVLDSSSTGELRVYFPGVPDTNGDGVASIVVPAGGSTVSLALPAQLVGLSASDPASGQVISAANCEAGAATGISNRATASNAAMLAVSNPELSVTKVADPPVAAPGGTVTYTVNVKNASVTAQGI